ncbi:MAG: M48 family metalloprotease [Candidatus Alcyoniella australis]|nr:M48 family metalloprotease [Candidatus Alcyoniella australis]
MIHSKKLRQGLAALLFIAMLVPTPVWPMSVGEEVEIGRELAQKFIVTLPMVEDPEINRYVRRIGLHVVDSNQPQLFQYHFYVVRNNSINAFALPGGFIFVNTGLIMVCDSEAELAGVLSHEIGHVTNRHISRRIEKMSKMNLLALAALIAGAFLAKDAETFAAVASAGLAVSSTASLAYSRTDEEEADRTAVRYMRAAGYRPDAMYTFMQKLLGDSPDPTLYPPYMSTHPFPTQRVGYLAGLSDPLGMDVGRLERTPGRFRKIQIMLIAQEKDLEDAINTFRDMQFADPDDPDALYGMALAYARQRRDEQALQYFSQAISLRPQDSVYRRDLGIFELKRGRVEPALASLEQSYQLNSDDLTTLMYLGLAFQEDERFEQAAVYFERGMNLDDEELNFVYHLGRSRGAAGDVCAGHYYLALYYERLGNKRLAEQNFKRAQEECSESPQFLKLVQDHLETANRP